jgi:hypothetical protein
LLMPSLAPGVQAQTPPKPGTSSSTTKSKTKSTTSKSPNVKTGEITAVDTKKKTVSIKDSAGMAANYALIEKTHCYKNKREAEPADFKAGDAVVVHIRHSRNGDAQAIELTDKTSWDWLDGIRHNVTTAKIKEIEDDALTVTIGAEALPLTFTVSDKTLWNKGGKEAKPADFKAGDNISIVPRSLPSGGIMASVVADNAQGAAIGKERKATSVHGVIQTLDSAMHTLTLKTEAGDTRILTYTETTEVHQNSKTLPLTSLKVGQSVGTRIRHEDDDKEIVWSITIGTAGRSKSTKKPGGTSGKSSPG